MKTTVIYHSADFDGIFCREIARQFLPEAELIGWNFGDKALPFPDKDTTYYVLDLPMNAPFGLRFEDGWLARDNPLQEKEHRQIQPIDRIDFQNWIWIDHHKSSIESYPKEIPGYRIDGVAACRLAWQWFETIQKNVGYGIGPIPQSILASKQDFIDRTVYEPMAVRLAGEYDIWDKRDPRAYFLQFGLRAIDLTPEVWQRLLSDDGESQTLDLVKIGRIASGYQERIDSAIMRANSFFLNWEGLRFLALNTARCNSNAFRELDVPESGHDALLSFYQKSKSETGKERFWTVSMYHTRDKKELDLSEIAKKHGGGGHRGACGFTCKELPF